MFPEDISRELTTDTPDPITLRFRPELEREFEAAYFEESLPYIHLVVPIGLAIIALFGILDCCLAPSVIRELLLVRFGLICPVVALIAAFSYTQAFRRYMQVTIAVGTMITGLGLVAGILIAPPPASYLLFGSVLLVLICACTFLRLTFPYVVLTSIVISAAYELALIEGHTPGSIIVTDTFYLIGTVVISGIAGYSIELYTRRHFIQEKVVKEQAEEIKRQQELAESLLLNTLPSEVAAELKEKGAVAPRYYEDVTILFTDFKGFTLETERLAAEELVNTLNEYFTAFDEITSRYGLEKLKTIGDSYMCVAGLPTYTPSHAVDAMLAAFEMLAEVKRRKLSHPAAWSIRIGLHTGPVISGVVGIRKLAFDIWGESVNFASRMESSGHPDHINLSASTYTRVKDFFACEHRGRIATKEKREYDMYFANGILPSLLHETQEGMIPAAFLWRYHNYFHKNLEHFPQSLLQRSVINPPHAGWPAATAQSAEATS